MPATSFPRAVSAFVSPTSPSTGLFYGCECDTLEPALRASDILDLNIVGRTDEDFAVTPYFLRICWKFEEVKCNDSNAGFHNDS
jgi:hypothetical protein